MSLTAQKCRPTPTRLHEKARKLMLWNLLRMLTIKYDMVEAMLFFLFFTVLHAKSCDTPLENTMPWKRFLHCAANHGLTLCLFLLQHTSDFVGIILLTCPA